MNDISWSLAKIWNESLEQRESRPLEYRDHMWASELGGSYVDRFLKMKGTPMSNPPNPRSLRKFEAGNLIEWVVGVVLKRAGIMIDAQKWVGFQYPGLLKVTGKSDYKAGGVPDYEKGRASIAELEGLGLPKIFVTLGTNVIDHFSKTYPQGLKKATIEVKSTSSFMYDKFERAKKPEDNHMFQAFHYLKAEEEEEAHIVYVSKDDLRMIEFGVFNPSGVEDKYKADIETMTKYFRADEQPPLEEPISYDEADGKFYANWKVGYSNYLTLLYGIKDQMSFDEQYKPLAAKANRVFKRCVLGKNMTKLNLEAIAEVKNHFPHFDELVDKGKVAGLFKGEEEDES